jgi:hypothetical protein
MASTGVLSGTATVAGTYSVVVSVTDSTKQTISKTLSSLVVTPLVISTTALTPAVIGSPYNFTLTATGGTGNYVWTSTVRPAWLALSSTGVLSGTPTAAAANSITYTATDSSGAKITKLLTLSTVARLVISTASLPNATQGVAYSSTLASTGGTGTKVWSLISGPLPAGMTLSSTGVLSGKPTAAGTYPVTIGISDSSQTSNTSLVITVL